MGFNWILLDFMGFNVIYPLVNKHGWKIPELNGGI